MHALQPLHLQSGGAALVSSPTRADIPTRTAARTAEVPGCAVRVAVAEIGPAAAPDAERVPVAGGERRLRCRNREKQRHRTAEEAGAAPAQEAAPTQTRLREAVLDDILQRGLGLVVRELWSGHLLTSPSPMSRPKSRRRWLTPWRSRVDRDPQAHADRP